MPRKRVRIGTRYTAVITGRVYLGTAVGLPLVARQLSIVPAPELSPDHVRAALDGRAPLAVLPDGPPAAVDAALAALRPDEPLEPGTDLVVVTSGSTGSSRGVLLSAAAMRAS